MKQFNSIVASSTNTALFLAKHQPISATLPPLSVIAHGKSDEPSPCISNRPPGQIDIVPHPQLQVHRFQQMANHERVTQKTKKVDQRPLKRDHHPGELLEPQAWVPTNTAELKDMSDGHIGRIKRRGIELSWRLPIYISCTAAGTTQTQQLYGLLRESYKRFFK